GRTSSEYGSAGYAPGHRSGAAGSPIGRCGHRDSVVGAAAGCCAGPATVPTEPAVAAATSVSGASTSAACTGAATTGTAAHPTACAAARRPAAHAAAGPGPTAAGAGVCPAFGHRRTALGDRTDPHRTQSGRAVRPRGTDHGRIPFDLQDATAAQPDREGDRGDRSTLHERLRRRP